MTGRTLLTLLMAAAVAAVLADRATADELNLTTGEREVIQKMLEKLVRERAGGNASAKLTNPINIGVGTKR